LQNWAEAVLTKGFLYEWGGPEGLHAAECLWRPQAGTPRRACGGGLAKTARGDCSSGRLARLSHLEGIFDYFRFETGVKLSACKGGISEAVAVKTYRL
jgi:hypothetical protein